MSEHPNAVNVRRAFEAYNQRDFETFSDLLSEDIVSHMADPSQRGAQVALRGRSELVNIFKAMDQLSGGTQHVEPESILADDEHVMVFMRGTAERPGKKTHDFRFVTASRVNSDGRWKEVWYLADDERGHEEFWAE